MSKDMYSFLTERFSAYEIVYSKSKDRVEIANPYGKDNIIIDYDPDDITPFTVRFSFQHRHIKDDESVIEYVTDIINGRVLVIEFFQKGKNCFGGDITVQELNKLSYEFLEKRTGYYGTTKLKDIVDSLKVRGWNLCNNFDATFICDESGNITLAKTKSV